MIRNTDYIKSQEEKNPSQAFVEEKAESYAPENVESEIHEALSDSQIRRVRGGKVSKLPSAIFSRDSGIAFCYKTLLEIAKETRDFVRHGKRINPAPILAELHHILTKDLVKELYQYAICAPDNEDWLVFHGSTSLQAS